MRDYLERTYIHKVSYEEVKFEYETKIKLREYLDAEKQGYERRREDLKRAVEREGATRQELVEERNKLLYLLESKEGLAK